MTKRLLAVDCDLTICPSDKGWLDYLKYYNGLGKIVQREDGKTPYNLAEIFPHVREPMLYWKELDYTQFQPLEGSVEALRSLSQYFEIVFVSQQSGNHGKSKYYWLKEWFPFKIGVILTHEKFVMKDAVVGIIDDRMNHLQGFDYHQRILFETPYTQDVEIPVAMSFDVWDNSVVEKICDVYL